MSTDVAGTGAESTGATVRLVVADDQAAIRDALATMLDLLPGIEVVGTAANGVEAVAAVVEHHPDVILMDLRMPELDGVGATIQITQQFPDVAVLVLTTFDDDESILSALQAGARGYLTKESGRADIARAIAAAAAGQSVLDPAVQQRVIQAMSRASSAPAPTPATATAPAELPDGLTRREGDVLALIAEGLSNKEIASRLFVSEATVKTHINNLFMKAQLRDRAQAVHYAFTRGIVTPSE